MSQPQKTFIYSSQDTPKLLRPAKPDEQHIWYHPNGKILKLNNGVWEEITLGDSSA